MIWSPPNQLIIDYNSLYQLEIITPPGIKKTTVQLIVDETKTGMGRRLLKNWLVCPINDSDEINRRYNNIDWARTGSSGDSGDGGDKPRYQELQIILNNIVDIEKLQQKITRGKLQPSQFLVLDNSYNYLIQLMLYIQQAPTQPKLQYQITPEELKLYMEDYRQTFVMDRMNCTLEKLDQSIFVAGIYPEIEALDLKIKNYQTELDKTQIYLNAILQDKFGKKTDLIKLKKTEKSEDYYFSLTNTRYNYLASRIDCNYFKVTSMSSGKKLTANSLDKISQELVSSKLKLRYLVAKYYVEYLSQLSEKYLDLMTNIVQYVAEIDVICSNAKISVLYKYCRPEIDFNSGKSYIEAQDLRHPVVERISKEFFVPNDINLGQEVNGMLLYGINGIGKTVITLTVAINLIMAQAGLYVPASKFKYRPFNKVMTRLTANHGDISQGKGSFEIEMIELRKIIQRADNKTLVIADEISRGTEHISALGIVAATVKHLAEKQVNFLLATHIHELTTFIKDLPNVKVFHLTIETNQGQIIYKRKLKEGNSIPLYGIEICRALGMPKDFVSEALKIRRQYNQEKSEVVACKTSHYNSESIVDQCEVCDNLKDLHTHHIIYQSESDCHNFLPNGLHKNSSTNLVTLCSQCHHLVHQNKIKITGYKQTDEGMKLIYNSS